MSAITASHASTDSGAKSAPAPYWNPYLAGFGLGLVLLAAYLGPRPRRIPDLDGQRPDSRCVTPRATRRAVRDRRDSTQSAGYALSPKPRRLIGLAKAGHMALIWAYSGSFRTSRELARVGTMKS